jgi:hypothetical protein
LVASDLQDYEGLQIPVVAGTILREIWKEGAADATYWQTNWTCKTM